MQKETKQVKSKREKKPQQWQLWNNTHLTQLNERLPEKKTQWNQLQLRRFSKINEQFRTSNKNKPTTENKKVQEIVIATHRKIWTIRVPLCEFERVFRIAAQSSLLLLLCHLVVVFVAVAILLVVVVVVIKCLNASSELISSAWYLAKVREHKFLA